MRFMTAIRCFFAVLSDAGVAAQISKLLSGGADSDEPQSRPEPVAVTRPPEPNRSEALTLIATLQREARFLDFVKESLDGATDEQIGAVVRDVHRDCATVMERMFAVRPLVDADEGAELEVPEGFDAGNYKLTGNVQGSPPFRGRVGHHGWKATRVDLPVWSGAAESRMTIAPVELDV